MQNALSVPGHGSALAHTPATALNHGYVTGSGSAMGLNDLYRILQRYKFMILLCVGLVTIAVLAQQLLSPTIYRSTAHVQVELIDEVGTNQADVNSRNAQRVANAVLLHRSRSSAERVIADLKLLDDPRFMEELGNPDAKGFELRQLAVNHLLSMIAITTEPESDLLEISVSSQSPELAAEIANQIPVSVGAVRNSKSNERRSNLLASLEEEQKLRGEEAQKAAQKVADFRRQNQMLVGAGGQEDLAQLNRIVAEAASASAMRDGSAARSSGVAAAGSMQSVAQASSPALEQLERQRAELLSERSRLGSSFGPNHPDVRRVNEQLATVESNISIERNEAQAAARAVANAESARITQLARSEAARDAATASRLQGIAASLEGQAYRNTANSVELDQLVRESTLADEAYSTIAARVEQVRAQMQLEGVSSSIVSPAVPDYGPIAPAPLKMGIFAFLGSGAIALMVAFLRDFMDDRLRTAAQVRRHFGLPTFGMLPLINTAELENSPSSPVIEQPQSLFSEVARSAYCDVRALQEIGQSQVVLMTSPLPGDGKSTVSLTLAAAGVAMGSRTLVLDLDLRKRGLLQRLQSDLNSPDLVDIISGRANLDSLVPAPVTSETGMLVTDENSEPKEIALLSAHEPISEPAALLSSPKLKSLLEELRQRFDLIIINAPATLAVRDARAMCDFADQTVMVARWGHTTIDQMRASLEMLSDNVCGVIFDHVDYAEHARRRYGDSVQFYVDASDYYSDNFRHPETMTERVRRWFKREPEMA